MGLQTAGVQMRLAWHRVKSKGVCWYGDSGPFRSQAGAPKGWCRRESDAVRFVL